MIPIIVPEKIEKPWGWELWVAVTDKYAGKILHINPGQKLSRQYHRRKDETVYVMSGNLHVDIGKDKSIETIILPGGKSLRIAPGMIHRFMAAEDGPVELFETSTPELDDIVRIEDIYGRKGTTHR